MSTTLLSLFAALTLANPAPPGPQPEPELLEGMSAAPWQDLVLEECAAHLDDAHIDYSFVTKRRRIKRIKAPRTQKPEWPVEVGDMHCWVPQALHYRGSLPGLKWSGYVMVNCRMALALAELERVAQDEATRFFGEGKVVTRIKQYGAYNCRRIKAYPWVQSQHSFGNAIDIGAFVIKGVGTVDVKKHWRPRWPSLQSRSDFLHAVARRLYEEGVFTVVLTPGNDDRHRSHLHIDLAP